MDLTPALTVYGPLGIGVAALGWVCLKLYAAREKERETFQARIDALQEKRLEETVSGRAQMVEVVNTLKQAIAMVQGAVR